MQIIPSMSNRVRNYINFNLKFHDYSMVFHGFHVAITCTLLQIKPMEMKKYVFICR